MHTAGRCFRLPRACTFWTVTMDDRMLLLRLRSKRTVRKICLGGATVLDFRSHPSQLVYWHPLQGWSCLEHEQIYFPPKFATQKAGFVPERNPAYSTNAFRGTRLQQARAIPAFLAPAGIRATAPRLKKGRCASSKEPADQVPRTREVIVPDSSPPGSDTHVLTLSSAG